MSPEKISRRDFLKGTATVAGVVTALLEAPYLTRALRQTEIDHIADLAVQQFGLTEFRTDGKTHYSNLKALPPGHGSGGTSYSIGKFYEALTQYSPQYYAALQEIPWPWGIVACTNLQLKEPHVGWSEIGGTVVGNQNDGLSVFLNMYGVPVGNFHTTIIHHELWHLVSNPTVLQGLNFSESIDDTLAAIDAKYGLSTDGVTSYERATTCKDDPAPTGFARCYGEWNTQEDGATIAEGLMTGDFFLWQRASRDQALAEKIDKIIDVYSALTQGEMGESYFDAVRRGHKTHWNWTQLGPIF